MIQIYYHTKTYYDHVGVFTYIIRNNILEPLYELEFVFGFEEEIKDYINNHTEIKEYKLIHLEDLW